MVATGHYYIGTSFVCLVALGAVLWQYSQQNVADSTLLPAKPPTERPQAVDSKPKPAKKPKKPKSLKQRDVLAYGKLPPGKIPLGVAMSLHPFTGWGQQGMHLFEPLGDYFSLLCVMPKRDCLDKDYSLKPVFSKMWKSQKRFVESVHVSKQQSVLPLPFPVIHGVGGAFASDPRQHRVWGSKNVAYTVFETSSLSSQGEKRAKEFDLVLTSSQWNYEVLKKHGVNAARIIQGVDTNIYKPKEGGDFDWSGLKGVDTSKLGKSKFVIFSGGKLELRKGQDIVVAAFRKFAASHPNAVLVTSWYNTYPQTMQHIAAAGLVKGVPSMNTQVRPAVIDFESWFEANGIAKSSVLALQAVAPSEIAQLLQRADAALFPNRCEGSTNFVAMEALASGVPTVISDNSGHSEIVDTGHCFPLKKQSELKPPLNKSPSMAHWRDSDVDEAVEHLEYVYSNPVKAKAVGIRAVKFMRTKFTWAMANQAWADAMEEHGIE